MPTPRSVDYIKSKLLRPALTSHFEVEIPIPDALLNVLQKSDTLKMSSEERYKLNISCTEASLPGSSLATLEINNDYTGVTERHAYRRIYDDRIDFTFYVDAQQYLPIMFFESWIKYIAGESKTPDTEMRGNLSSSAKNYFYRVRYPDEYVVDQGLKVIKFERDYKSRLEYEFIRAYPISIQSMPVSYDSSNLLKCTVSMTYIRYLVSGYPTSPVEPISDQNRSELSPIPNYDWSGNYNPIFENQFNYGGISDQPSRSSGNAVDRRVEAGLPGVGRVGFAEPSIFDPQFNFNTFTLNRQ